MNHKFVVGSTVLTSKDLKDFDAVYDKMSSDDRDILVAKGIEAVTKNPDRYLPEFIEKIKELSKKVVGQFESP